MDRSGFPSVLVIASLLVAGPVAAANITFLDFDNAPGHLYRVSDTVRIGVYIEGPLLTPITRFNFHLTSDSELSITLADTLPPLGWLPNAYLGGTCDLLDPLGLCIGAHDPTGTGSILPFQQIGLLEFDVVDVGSGEATVSALFAIGDGILDGSGFDIAPTFDLVPATILIVPEPASFGCVALGLAWLARRSRRGARRPAQGRAGRSARK